MMTAAEVQATEAVPHPEENPSTPETPETTPVDRSAATNPPQLDAPVIDQATAIRHLGIDKSIYAAILLEYLQEKGQPIPFI